jgi:hypothetical protein
MPASTASQMLQAFRFLRLVGMDGQVTADLRFLIEHPESRRAVLSKVLRAAYPELLSNNGDAIPLGTVEDFMSRMGLSGSTRRKAVMFFLGAADYAGLTVSGAPLPEAELDLPGVGNDTKRTTRVDLRGGGSIEISVEIDPFRLTKQDREFLFDLVDRVRNYQTGLQNELEKDLTSDEEPF